MVEAAKKAAPKKAAAKKSPLDQEPVSGILVDDQIIPAPITPATPGEAAQSRVLYENAINDAAREFGRQAELAYIEAALAGQILSLTISEE